MTSIDDFDPRFLVELAQHAKGLPKPTASISSLPSDYYYVGARKGNAPTSQLENKDPSELPPPRGKVVSTPQEYLQHINVDELRKSIRSYHKSSRKELTRPDIRRKLFRVLRAPELSSIVIPFRHSAFNTGLDLYRARTISALKQIRTLSDVWTAPPSSIGAGRLNDVGEPLLYTASNAMTAAFEIHAQPGDLVAMTQFRTVRRVLALDVAADITVQGLTMAEQRKLSLIMSFLEGLFSQPNPTHETSRYIAPDLVAKEIINPFPDLYAGWRFKSVADTRGLPWTVNLALKSSPAKDLLEHVRTDIVEVDPTDGISGRQRIISSLVLAPNQVDLVLLDPSGSSRR